MDSIRTRWRVRGVVVSGYDAWRRRAPSPRAVAARALSRRIRTIHAVTQGPCGGPRSHAGLEAEGVLVGRKRIARLMRRAGLAASAVAGGRAPRCASLRPGRR